MDIKLNALIQKYRKELHETIDKYGLDHKLTIEKSQELDKLVAEQQRAIFLALLI
jgi:hypothetical protein